MKLNKIYAVESKTRFYIGTYVSHGYDFNKDKLYILKGVIQKNKPKNNPNCSYFMCPTREIISYDVIFPNHIVYDLEEIRENGKKARQSMEQRALNIVLKRLVNEEFQWS